MANYPVSIPSFTVPTATSPRNSPSHATAHSREMEEIVAIATALGTNPQGTAASVAVRLTTVDALIAAISTGTGSLAVATKFSIGATSPTTSGDVVVTISTITAPFSAVVQVYNDSGAMVIPDSIIATATQFTVNLASYLATGTLAGTYGGVYIV